MKEPLDSVDSSAFLGKTLLAVMLVSDIRKTMSSLALLGIGPWSLYRLGPHNVTDAQYRGRPLTARLELAMASVGSLTWELIQPIDGECAQQEYLSRHGNGIHHFAVDCNDLEWDRRVIEFEKRGFSLVQSGIWLGRVNFGYFESPSAGGMVIESVAIPSDFVFPPPDEVYP